MAEGGIAAAMGNVWKEDNWKVHFRDTMRGGKLLNNWRMAQLHAMEAPDRVLELEEWGALFDRTKDGRILQRDFGGHRYARLAHVGDRTGLEMIRTLQQHAVHKGIDVLHGVHRPAPAQGRRPRLRRVRLLAASGQARGLQGQGGRPRHRRHRQGVEVHVELLGVHRRRHHARRSTPAPSSSTWSASSSTRPAWSGRTSVRGILVTEGVRGDGGTLQELRGQALHVQLHPRVLQGRDGGQREGSRRLVRGQEATGGRRTSCRATRSPARSTPRSRRAGAPPTAASSSTSARAARADYIRKRLPVDVPPVQGAGRRRHHQGADGGRARPATT